MSTGNMMEAFSGQKILFSNDFCQAEKKISTMILWQFCIVSISLEAVWFTEQHLAEQQRC